MLAEILKRRRDRLICSIFGKEVVHGADILVLIKKCWDSLIFLIICTFLCIVALFVIGFVTLGVTGTIMLILYPTVSPSDPQIIITINDLLMSGNALTLQMFPIVGLISSIIGAVIFGIVHYLNKAIHFIIRNFSEFKLAEYHRKP